MHRLCIPAAAAVLCAHLVLTRCNPDEPRCCIYETIVGLLLILQANYGRGFQHAANLLCLSANQAAELETCHDTLRS